MKLGIQGTGHMAATMALAAAEVPGLDVAAVLSRQGDRAAAFCGRVASGAAPHSEPEAFYSAVDAVYIASPPGQHAAMIRAAIAAGVPVLCEKPLSPSAAETEALLAEARTAGVLVMELIWTLALPAYRALAERLKGTGPARLTFDFSFPLRAPKDSHYFDAEVGGVLLDRAVYGYAPALSLLGPVTAQHAFVGRNEQGLDVTADLRLSHDTGSSSVITLSMEHLGSNRLDVATTQGAALLGPPSLAAETLAWSDAPQGTGGAAGKPGLKDKLKAMPALRKAKARLSGGGSFHGFGGSCYAPILAEFQACVGRKATESDLVPHALSARIAALTAEARSA